jgi:glutaredoxin
MTIATVYSKRDCTACHEAKALLEYKGVAVTEIVVSGAIVLVSAISTLGNPQGLPQIFIGNTRIGGLEKQVARRNG